jgi:N-formylglutamate amidohydrolase
MEFPYLISIPHCSSLIPKNEKPLFSLTEEEIQDSIDLGTKEIFGSLPAAAILYGEWSRLLVDLNRGPEEREIKGVIPQIDYKGRQVYNADISMDEARVQGLLKSYYWPYHNRIKKLICSDEIVGLIDCHSLNGIGPPESPDPGKKRKDIVLGNNGNLEGSVNPKLGKLSCPAEIIQKISRAFETVGFSVSINNPYSGGYITGHYGKCCTRMGKFAIQIEINQDLYISQKTLNFVPEKLEEIKGLMILAFKEVMDTL